MPSPILKRRLPGFLAARIALLCGILSLAATPAAASGAAEVLQGKIAARAVRVIDVDSLKVEAQIWLGQVLRIQVRLDGVDAPELRGRCEAEKTLAHQARAELARLVGPLGGPGFPLRLSSVRNDKYGGRVLAKVSHASAEAAGDGPANLSDGFSALPAGAASETGPGAQGLRDRADLGAILLAKGLARPYAGGRRASWCARHAEPQSTAQEVFLRPRRKPTLRSLP